MKSKLIGKTAYITNRDSQYYNEWGTIQYYDGDYYHIAIADGKDNLPIFSRDEFKIRRTKEEEHIL
jgi:hypothetical protein